MVTKDKENSIHMSINWRPLHKFTKMYSVNCLSDIKSADDSVSARKFVTDGVNILGEMARTELEFLAEKYL